MTLQAPKRRSCKPSDWQPRNVPGQRAPLSDVLTGVLIAPEDRVKVLRTPAKVTKPRYLQATGDLIATPLALHKSARSGGNEGLGLAYAVMMARYLDLALTEQKTQLSAEERLALIAWWDSAYGIARVRRGLCEKLSEDEANHTLLAVMACHQEHGDPDVIGARYGHDGAWLRERLDWCMRLANRRSHEQL